MAPLTSIISKYIDHEIEVAAGIVTTKFMVEVGRGNTDFTNAAFSPYAAMQNQKGIFKNLEGADEIAANIRYVFNKPGEIYHILAFEKSGVEDWNDLKGRKIYIGPINSGQYSTMSPEANEYIRITHVMTVNAAFGPYSTCSEQR